MSVLFSHFTSILMNPMHRLNERAALSDAYAVSPETKRVIQATVHRLYVPKEVAVPKRGHTHGTSRKFLRRV